MLAKCILNILQLNWYQRFGEKIENLSSYAQVVHTTAKQITASRGKVENGSEIYKNEKCSCKSFKTTVLYYQICKFVTFLSQPSSWLLKLSNDMK